MASENKMGTMPEGKLIVTMSFPIMLSMLVQALYNIIDSAFVARISEDALTAVSLAFPVQLLMIACATGLGVGMNALLSRRLGQHKQAAADAAAMNGIFLSVCFWLLFAVLGLLLGRRFIAAFTDVPAVAEMGAQYVTIVTAASCGVFLLFAAERLMQATGNTVHHMVTQLIGVALNCIFDPLLIFGLGPFPALGTAGAALATVSAQIIAMLIGFSINIRFNRDIHLRLRGFRPDKTILCEIIRIGLPAAFQQSLLSLLTICINRILMSFSQTAVNLYGVYYKLQNFLYMPVYGLNNALIPIVGYNFGAGRHDRIHRVTRLALLLALGIMAAGTLLFEALPVPLLRLFDASDTMLAIGVPAIRLIALSFCLAGASVILCGCMQGLGKSGASLAVALLRQLIVVVPAALLLARISLRALWLAFPLAEAVGLAAALVLYRRVTKRLSP
ncbi:MAG: MATE family efflux transporter [Agathobaculum sp.]|uniref:MATE family efflux transporter n=1 Tax=Agathobaculum sp. TaxID=2048138 RepID=UPI0025B92B31|nr:MATE family efflux transporter [Agathobaculum sp.]MCI7125379.1 MATE family efflux transporter [Agathobaculum sp.]MDY3711701.1 MATE family efflux transporter [Agathobaculum sp.]